MLAQCLARHRLDAQKWHGVEAQDPGFEPGPDDVVTQLYTSGTTGLPKGAMISGRNISCILTEADRVFRIQAVSDVVAFGFGAHAFVGIKTVPGAVDEVAAALVRRDDVSQLTRVLNGFDLVGVVIAPDHGSLVSAVFDEIALLPPVSGGSY